MPAPVIVMKDVGGPVADYQSQTAISRASEREVRLHECRSACTTALGLPNVCVYPGSALKFHLAYDPRNHQTNPEVSQQLFDSYPAAVRARLGTLTRDYKVLSGSELIELGIRDCNEPPLAAQPGAEKPLLAGVMDKMLSIFGASGAASAMHNHVAVSSRPAAKLAEIPLPPARPVELTQTAGAIAVQAPGQLVGAAAGQPATEPSLAEATHTVPLPARRPPDAALSAVDSRHVKVHRCASGGKGGPNFRRSGSRKAAATAKSTRSSMRIEARGC
jgi:hypothetical protein